MAAPRYGYSWAVYPPGHPKFNQAPYWQQQEWRRKWQRATPAQRRAFQEANFPRGARTLGTGPPGSSRREREGFDQPTKLGFDWPNLWGTRTTPSKPKPQTGPNNQQPYSPTGPRTGPTGPGPRNQRQQQQRGPGRNDPMSTLLNQLLGGLGMKPIGLGMYDDGADLFPLSMAQQMAQQQFSAPLSELNRLLANASSGGSRTVDSIRGDYSAIRESAEAAEGKAKKNAEDTMEDISESGADIISSLGGEANPGSGMIGNATQAAAAMSRQLGSADEGYFSALGPELMREEASLVSQAEAANNEFLQMLQMQRLQMLGEQGALENQYKLDFMGRNADIEDQRLARKLGLMQYNQGLGQQGFSNNLAMLQTLGALSMNEAQADYWMRSLQQANKKPQTFTPWAKLDPSQKGQLIDKAVANVLDSEGASLYNDPNKAWDAVRKYLVSIGYAAGSNPAMRGMAMPIIQAALRRLRLRNQQNQQRQQ